MPICHHLSLVKVGMYIAFYYFYALFIRLPLVTFLRLLSLLFNGPWKRRRSFEWKNRTSKYSTSFNSCGKKADICFHFSSVGELEQVRAVIEEYLVDKKLVELIYTSPSAEDYVTAMLSEFPEQIRAKRVEFLNFSIFPHRVLSDWISAPVFSMCRYDFIPELVMQTRHAQTSVLFNASMKNKLSYGFYQFNVKQFNIVFCASREDHLEIKKLGVKNCETFDFRSKRILSRQIEFSRAQKNQVPY